MKKQKKIKSNTSSVATLNINENIHWQFKTLCTEKRLKIGEQADKILSDWITKNSKQSQSAKVG